MTRPVDRVVVALSIAGLLVLVGIELATRFTPIALALACASR